MADLEAIFRDDWKRKRASHSSFPYIEGENRRVDQARATLPPGQRLLDVGCGSGVLGIALRGQFDEIHGVDIADEAVAIARDNGVRAVKADIGMQPLPFESEFFDCVALLSVLQYIYDPLSALQECNRVLKHGGVLAVTVSNMRNLGKIFRLLIRGRFPRTSKAETLGYDGGALHYFCSADLSELLARAGFGTGLKTGIFLNPQWLERRSPGPIWWQSLTTEFLAGEIYLQARKVARH